MPSIKFYQLFFLLSFSLLFATVVTLADECRDEGAYTVYFYADTDAKVLKEQRCEGSAGESKRESIISKGTCQCYSMGHQDVVSKLSQENGPVAVTTKKMEYVARNITCQSALNQCEKACLEESKKQDEKNCSSLNFAGIVAP